MITVSLLNDLQAAEGGSAALDERICDALGWDKALVAPFHTLPLYYRFTRSYDAAMTLLPPTAVADGDSTYDWVIGKVNGSFGGTPFAQLGQRLHAYGATPILSFVLGCLRVRLMEDLLTHPRLDRIPEPGDHMIFLGCGGLPGELDAALQGKAFEPGLLYQIEERRAETFIYYKFVEREHWHNGTMFGLVDP